MATQSEGCDDPSDAPPQLTRRYRAALARATGYDRVFLMEQRQLWLDQRADCALREIASECVADLDRRRYDELRQGSGLENSVNAIPPAYAERPKP